MSEETRSKVARAIQVYGAAAVGRALGASRNLVLSYVAGTARDGSIVLVEQRADRLTALDQDGATRR